MLAICACEGKWTVWFVATLTALMFALWPLQGVLAALVTVAPVPSSPSNADSSRVPRPFASLFTISHAAESPHGRFHSAWNVVSLLNVMAFIAAAVIFWLAELNQPTKRYSVATPFSYTRPSALAVHGLVYAWVPMLWSVAFWATVFAAGTLTFCFRLVPKGRLASNVMFTPFFMLK